MARYVRIHRRFVNLRPRPDRAFEDRFRLEFLALTALWRPPAVFAALAALVLDLAFRPRPFAAFLALGAARTAGPREGGFRPAGRRPGAPRAARLRTGAFLRRGDSDSSLAIASVTSPIAAMPSVALCRPFFR
jgi:hypothetical protein